MKKIALFITTGILLFTVFSCSKDENCNFSKSTFENKTYKTSIVRIDSSGVDVTSRYSALLTIDPCFNNTTTLNASGTYTTNKVSNCTDPAISGVWSVNTTNGKNYFVLDGSSSEVSAFDCNSVSIKENNGNITFTFKMTKI
jgi:hypothetical protein